MQEEDLDLSQLPEEERVRLFKAMALQLLDKAGFDQESYRAELRRKFETAPEPLFFSTRPKTIKLGKLGKKLFEIPLEKFESHAKITWSDSPLLGQEIRTELFRDTDFPRGFNAAIAEYLHRDISNFAICDINETVGKGLVFVPSAAKPTLPAGTVLGLYTGILSSAHTGNDFYAYGYRIDKIPETPTAFSALGLGKPFFDAERYRNITSYVQHAPDENTLSQIKNLPDEIKACIARANVLAAPSVHCGVDVLLFCTSRDIRPEKDQTELLFLDYGSYFEGKSYQLFDIQGNTVGTVNANNELEIAPGYIPPANPRETPKVLPEKDIVKIIENESHEAQNVLTLYFFEQVKFVIELYRKRNIPETEKILGEFIQNLAKIKESGTAHDLIDKVVTIDKKLDPYPALHPLRQELICLLLMHNAFLHELIKFREQFQTDPKTRPINWGNKTGKWGLFAIKEKACLGLVGKTTELNKAKNDLAHLSPFILNWGKEDLLAIAVSVIFAREAENREHPLPETQKAQLK